MRSFDVADEGEQNASHGALESRGEGRPWLWLQIKYTLKLYTVI